MATRAPHADHPGAARPVAPDTASRIESLRGAGHPLPDPTRSFFERRIGRDFGDVQVHAGGAAARLSESLSARAFTYGNDVFFGAGEYRPDSPSGRRLLAHELTHVAQQSSGARRKVVRRYASGSYSYAHNVEACPVSFMKDFVWPGHNRAFRMVKHALHALCAATYGNRSARNDEARVQMVAMFGSGWRDRSKLIYRTLRRLRHALLEAFTYDCDTRGRFYCKWDPPNGTEWANTGGGSEINLCFQNLRKADLAKFALVVLHEHGHRIGLAHGSDDESESCSGEIGDAQCMALFVEMMWNNVGPNYEENGGDTCMGMGGTDASQWDD